MRLLACGDRNWSDRDLLVQALDSFGYRYLWDFVLVHGAARGADSLAKEWAESRGIPVDPFPAEWDRYGRSAGPIRNQQMLRTGIDLVVAFHDDIRQSKGTKHMVTIARAQGVPVQIVKHGPPPTNVLEVR